MELWEDGELFKTISPILAVLKIDLSQERSGTYQFKAVCNQVPADTLTVPIVIHTATAANAALSTEIDANLNLLTVLAADDHCYYGLVTG